MPWVVLTVRGAEDRPWLWVKPAVPPCNTRANSKAASMRARFRRNVATGDLVIVSSVMLDFRCILGAGHMPVNPGMRHLAQPAHNQDQVGC